MLDQFLLQDIARKQQEEVVEKLATWMRKQPIEYLQKVASGKLSVTAHDCLKVANHMGEEWVSKFKGTPLFAHAMELEKADLTNDITRQQKQVQQDEARKAEGDQDLWRVSDQIRLQKKMLDLQLLDLENQLEAAQGAPVGDVAQGAGAMGAAPEIESPDQLMGVGASKQASGLDAMTVHKLAQQAAPALLKVAFGMKEVVDFAAAHPTATAAAAGGIAGGIHGAIAPGRDEYGRTKSRLGSMLTHGTMGAGLGAAAFQGAEAVTGIGKHMNAGKTFGEAAKLHGSSQWEAGKSQVGKLKDYAKKLTEEAPKPPVEPTVT